MACKTVFIVSEDPAVRDSLSRLVASAGLHAMALPSMEAWFETAGPEPCGCLVLDALALSKSCHWNDPKILLKVKIKSATIIQSRLALLISAIKLDTPILYRSKEIKHTLTKIFRIVIATLRIIF